MRHDPQKVLKSQAFIESHGGTLLYTPVNPLSRSPMTVMGNVDLFYGMTQVKTDVFLTRRVSSWGPFTPCRNVPITYQPGQEARLFLSSAVPFSAPIGSTVRVRQFGFPEVKALLMCRLDYELRGTHGLLLLDNPPTPPGVLWQIVWDSDVPIEVMLMSYDKLSARDSHPPWRLRNRAHGFHRNQRPGRINGILQENFPIQRCGPYPWLVVEWLGPPSVIGPLRDQGWILGTPFLTGRNLTGVSYRNPLRSAATVWMTDNEERLPFSVYRNASSLPGVFTASSCPPTHETGIVQWMAFDTTQKWTLQTPGQLPVVGEVVDGPTPDLLIIDSVWYQDTQQRIDSHLSALYHQPMTWVVAFHSFDTPGDLFGLVDPIRYLAQQAIFWEVTGWN